MTNCDNLPLEQQRCTTLKGVGSKTAAYLTHLGIHTIQDLLFHLPLRYEDRTQFKPLNLLQVGDRVQVEGEVVQAIIKEGRRRSFILHIRDAQGFLTLRFFYLSSSQFQTLSQVGQRIHCFGEIRRGSGGYEMVHPEYYLVKDNVPIAPLQNKLLTAIYPTTEGLHQYSLRKLTDQALHFLDTEKLQDYLPDTLLLNYHLPPLKAAIRYVHRPPAEAEQNLLQVGMHPAQKRLIFEELLAHQLSLLKMRQKARSLQGPKISMLSSLIEQFERTLPFSLTCAQKKVVDEIKQDLKNPEPMLRLLQGDVGSGKTIVAAFAALFVIASGFQVALMAPTELLAEQHYKNFSRWFNPLGLTVECLTSAKRRKAREETLNKMMKGENHLIIGTHALFQAEIQFAKLGLIIIDEQHRFGVHQRLALLQKGRWQESHPHQLVMSATPIPRTLMMSAYADLDCSTIDELPPGRKPVNTIILPNTKRALLMQRIKENCLAGAQAYWVCTLIQESDIVQYQAAEELTKALISHLPELRISLIHGKMKPSEKEQIMASFKNKEIDLLVATTVIEVGVDVPNANLMVIENPERLGLAQLHQLRGRVGRGTVESFCVLLYQSPLSKLAKERLAVLKDSQDGFVIAQKDLDLRGPGEVLGTRQTGVAQFKIADLSRDQYMLSQIQEAAKWLWEHSSDQVDFLIKRWLRDSEAFSDV